VRRFLLPVIFAAALPPVAGSCGAWRGGGPPPTPVPSGFCGGAPDDPGVPAVLYVTHSAGYRHAVLGHSVDVLTSIGLSAGTNGFAVRHQADARLAVTPDALHGCAAVVFFTNGELPLDNSQKALLLAFVSSGGGFAGIHSAADTFYSWPSYNELQGGWFNGHPWGQVDAGMLVEGTNASTAGLPPSFQVHDEIYQFKSFRQDLFDVRLRLDTATLDTSHSGVIVQPFGFPIAWTGHYGRGRVFYTALGHGSIWDDPLFRRHVTDGIAWASRGPD